MIVADVNLMVYLFIPGEANRLAEAVYERSSEWFAPALWRSELLNVLVGFVRRGTISLEAALQVFYRADEVVTVPGSASVPEEILGLSIGSGCTAYDCEYVALARRLDIPLVTGDKQVLRAFPEVAVSLEAYTS